MYKYRTLAVPGGGVTCVIRLTDGASIPLDPANNDYRAVLDWVALGNVIAPADPDPPPTQEALDIAAAKSYAKLAALKNMTPAQVQAWVAANVTNLAQAQDAICTLAIAVGILARRL